MFSKCDKPFNLRSARRVSAVLACSCVFSTFNVIGQQLPIIEYQLLHGGAPDQITLGPDGALWFTESYGNRIGRITTSGVITEYSVPTANSYPLDIVTGPDGALWFTEEWAYKIGRVTTNGAFSEYPLPIDSPRRFPYMITTGVDGALWFTLLTNIAGGYGKIGRITTDGVITEYPTELSSFQPFGIASAPDGALWFTEPNNIREVGSIGTNGLITQHPLDVGAGVAITLGPDGALWVTGAGLGAGKCYTVGRLTIDGTLTPYTEPGGDRCTQGPDDIAVGPDGALWYTRTFAATLGRITTEGAITVYGLPGNPGGWMGPLGVTGGPDGNVWFTEPNTNKIGVVNLRGDTTKPVSHVVPLPSAGSSPNFKVEWSGTDVGTGIRDYTIQVSDNGGPFLVWLNQTTATQAWFAGMAGHSYGFYSIARDWAGYQEDPKLAAEATTYVAAIVPGDVNGDGQVNCADIAIIKASFGKRTGQTGFDPRADVNHDGVVDVRDLAAVSQKLIPGTMCP